MNKMTLKVSAETVSPFDKKAQFLARRDAIIRSALQEFRKRGYHNVSMSDIATTLNLTKATLYYYVKGKHEIFYECHMMVYDAMDEIFKKKAQKDLSGFEQIESTYRDFVEMLTMSGQALLTDMDKLKGDAYETVLSRRQGIESSLRKMVDLGIRDGSVHTSQPKITVFFIMGALNWLNVWYDPEGALDKQTIADHFVKQMSFGLKGK